VKRVVLVGEDFGNSGYTDDRYALTGDSGRRLARMACVTPVTFYRVTYRINVVKTPEQWRDPEAIRAGVLRVAERIEGMRVPIVLLGSKVALAFDVLNVPLYEFTYCPRINRGVIRAPHPSGRNRLLNDQDQVARYGAFLKVMVHR
jgi:uracil-DNA glycosylase